MILTHVHHIGICSRNPQATEAFYCAVLGFDPVPAEQGGEPHMLRSGAVRLTIHAIGESMPRERPRGDHFAFEVESTVAEIAETLAERRIECQPVGGRVYLRDPDGYTIELVATPAAR